MASVVPLPFTLLLPGPYHGQRKRLDLLPFDVMAVYDAPAETAAVLRAPTVASDFILDSGSTHHMSPYERLMGNRRELRLGEPTAVQVGNGATLDVTGVGTLLLRTTMDDEAHVYAALQDVLIVPEMGYNLVSVSSLSDRRAKIAMEQGCNRVNTECFKVMRGTALQAG